MLQSLHVRNLALMEETEITFGEGLNILTGETGAGKSLLIGSVNLALGAKFEKEMLRKDAESALVELVFTDCERANRKLAEFMIDLQEDGSIFLSRKMQAGRSVFRINGEAATAKQVRELAEELLDIHGQHEHQSLLHPKKHLEILDLFAMQEGREELSEVARLFGACKKLERELAEETMDEAARRREQSLAEYELEEISKAQLVPGEDERLEQQYQRMVNHKKIAEGVSESYFYSGSDAQQGAANAIARAVRALSGLAVYDEQLGQLEKQILEIDALLAEYNRDLAQYAQQTAFSETEFREVEERLNTINRLKGKYGKTIAEILDYAEQREQFLEKLSDYETYMQGLRAAWQEKHTLLCKACEKLTKVRKKNALELSGRLKEALVDLNFLTVAFEVQVRALSEPAENGMDEVEFLISVNPGEPLRPLRQVASGGELSRIMLAIKTVLAGKDEIDTLIFDEIDTGISGRTAWKVAEKLQQVSRGHQVICITHLPQIAAMADQHYVIEKSSTDQSTITDVRALCGEEGLGEIARLLGSDALTEAALTNARELRNQAKDFKKK